MSGGLFVRIIYSTSLVSINGISIVFTLPGRVQEMYNNKYKYIFSNDGPVGATTREIIEKIRMVESHLLRAANIKDKTPQYKLFEQIQTGCFKFFQHSIYPKNGTHDPVRPVSVGTSNGAHTNETFVLKISGIWTTQHSYGITYKFTLVDNST